MLKALLGWSAVTARRSVDPVRGAEFAVANPMWIRQLERVRLATTDPETAPNDMVYV